MASRNKVLFNLNVNAPTRIKLLALHPIKEWVALITSANTFSLWNYRQRILIKSFNCNTLDDSKNFEIREMIFFDRHSLPFPSEAAMRTNIIFVSSLRIYLYDYLTDAIKQINEKEMEQKTIRKVCVYSESKICVSLNDGSFKVLDSRDLYSKNTMTIKNIRGYHTKPITWLTAYCQNTNDMPRVITVSAQDGLMACWNVDTLLHTPTVPDPATPSFKFIMAKGGRNDSNNGEEIQSLQYDNSSYRLVTLTESYITIWSTMTGMELRRIKNNRFREIAICNHFSFGLNCFLVHSAKSSLQILRLGPNDPEIEEVFDLRSVAKQPDCLIGALRTLPRNPSEVFIASQSSLVVIELGKFYRPAYGFHPAFTTRLTTLNSKQFVVKGEGSLRRDIGKAALDRLIFEEDILFNSFFVSYQTGWLHFHLLEIQIDNMLSEQRKYKWHPISQNSPLRTSLSPAIVDVRFDAKELLVFSPSLCYFEIYAPKQQKSQDTLLQLDDDPIKLDFHSKLQLVVSGHARDASWHQYKQQFAAIKGFDKQDRPVEYIGAKTGILGRGEMAFRLSAEVVSWHACVFYKNKKGSYELLARSEIIKSKLYRLSSFGFLFGYSSDQTGTEVVSFLNDEKQSNKEIEGVPFWPERVYSSYCESYQIFAYDGYFVIYRVQQNGQLSYFRSLQQTITDAIFWQKFFFFATKSGLYFLQITPNDLLQIKLADTAPPPNQNALSLGSDDLEELPLLLPEGHLQLIGVVNTHLLLLNQAAQATLLNLKLFPYVQFCIEVILGNNQRLISIFRSSGRNLRNSMRETLTLYGINIPQLSQEM